MKVYKECCHNCLLTPETIVSPERKKDIIKECIQEQKHFVCHKSYMEDGNVCCRKFYDELGHTSKMIRIAERLKIVEFVDHTCNTKLISYKELNK